MKNFRIKIVVNDILCPCHLLLFFYPNAGRLFLEGKQTAYGYFKGICDIHQRVKGDGCRHVRSFNIADMCAADAHHLSKLKLIQPLEFSVIGDV